MASQPSLVVIVADGDVDRLACHRATQRGGVRTVIAADGGASAAEMLGLRPDLVIGDADSLAPDDVARLRASGVPVHVVPTEKDRSDTELCLEQALVAEPAAIRILGALGGERVEHALANVALLGRRELDGRDVTIEHGPSTLARVGTSGGSGEIELEGLPGDWVSLLPIDPDVDGVRTVGLRYPLRDERLDAGSTRGLSNELTEPVARVAVGRGRLLVVHTRRAHPPAETT